MKFHSRLLYGVLGLCTLISLSCTSKNAGVDEEKLSVAFVQNEISIPINGEVTAVLEVSPESRADEVEFSLADNSVAEITGTVIGDGKVNVHLINEGKLGSTTLLALLEDELASCKISIAPVQVSGISLNTNSAELKVGQDTTLVATVSPEDATSPLISWRSSDSEVASVENGYVRALSSGSADITATCSGFDAVCHVEVADVEAESIVLTVQSDIRTDVEMSENESIIVDATLMPENITFKNVKWTVSSSDILFYEAFDAYETDNVVSARITALKAGDAVLSASIGNLSCSLNIKVKSIEVPAAEPKIGDYFYSDGTWSDGGLISISKDGTVAQWAEEKPAPLEGKTVIGIIFQTDALRISEYLKKDGYVHGLVFCTRAAHKPGEELTKYSTQEVDCIGTHALGSSWYDDIWGRKWTNTIMQYYPGTELASCPAFDWTVTDFQPAAPGNTSGWFVPSIGQLWDLMVNLGGPKVGEALLPFRTYDADITYYKENSESGYGDITVGCDVRAIINAQMAKVPESQKEELVISRPSNGACEIMSSTIYQKKESECSFWLLDNGKICATASWLDDPIVCRPILAF
ncbi:MAG: Ig-like domain-containing protein [Rikenellaceae bacterium]|nr:Ig-like domain-containing protein [Rikenellaceae bacterium]